MFCNSCVLSGHWVFSHGVRNQNQERIHVTYLGKDFTRVKIHLPSYI